MPTVYIKGYDQEVYFPEGVSPEEMKAAIKKKFPAAAAVEKARRIEESVPGQILTQAEKIIGYIPRLLGLAEPYKSLPEMVEERARREQELAEMPIGKRALEVTKEALMPGVRAGAAALPFVVPPLKGLKGPGIAARISRLIAPPISTGVSVGGARALEELAKGTPPTEIGEKAKASAITAGLIDTLIRGTFGIAGAGAKKILKRSIGPQFSEEVVEEVLKKPELTKAPKEKHTKIGDRIIKSVKDLEKKLGERVGRAKAQARKLGEEVNVAKVKTYADDLVKEAKLITEPGKKAAITRRPRILDQVMEQLDQPAMNIDDALTTLQNVDEILKSSYERMMRAEGSKKVLSQSEKIALRIRGKLNETINDVLANQLSRNKGAFKALRKILEANKGELSKKVMSRDEIYKLLKGSLKQANVPTYERLRTVEKSLRPQQKFMDEVIAKHVSEELSDASRLWPGFRLEGLFDMLAPIAATELRTGQKIIGISPLLSKILVRLPEAVEEKQKEEREAR